MVGLVRAAALHIAMPWVLAVFSSLVWAGDGQLAVRVTDASGHPVSEAVVWMPHADGEAVGSPEPVIVDQVHKKFVPHLTVIRAGTEVHFPNSDSVSHHVYSFARPNNFELPLYKGDVRPTVQFDDAGIVTLGCNIHDSMLGYIVVVDTPYFGVTDADGYVDFAVDELPVAEVSVWSPRLNPAKVLQAQIVSFATGLATVQVAVRQKRAPDPARGSLAWEEY